MNVVCVLMDSLNRHFLPAYGCSAVQTPNLDRVARKSCVFTNNYVGSLPCMPARRDLWTGRIELLHRPWGSLEPWDRPLPGLLRRHGVLTELITDHYHLFERGGENYHLDFEGWEFIRGHENDPWETAPAELPPHTDNLSARYWRGPRGILGVGALAAGAVSSTGRAAGLGRRVALILWLAAPLPLLAHLQGHYGFPTLGVCLLLAKIGDVAGYYAGSLLGGRFPQHPFPRVSPGKTSVGCLASLLAATAAGLAAAALGWLPAGRLGLLSGALAGALVNVAAQGGDLLESAAKRRAGVKDSGTLFGPSGGVLDLVDSLLLAVPVAVLVWPLLFA